MRRKDLVTIRSSARNRIESSDHMHSSALKPRKEIGPTLERCGLRSEQADAESPQALIGTRVLRKYSNRGARDVARRPVAS